jgi:UDP-2,4-diacetamido-2,4,6-trideoxy-beta-L-altropyranose hydrolase
MITPLGKPLLIRVDAGTKIGTGHAMRCLALAQAWQDAGGQAIFMMTPGAPMVEERLKSEGIEIIPMLAQPGSTDDADQTANLAQKVGASWLVVDGYQFTADYQRFVKDSGLRLLFVDDNGHADHYWADIVLNQNLHADEDLYVYREPYTRLLLGTRYVLLRREFLTWREWEREIPEVAGRVLVTLGGGDPDNVTLTVIQALQQVRMDGLEVVIVIGGSNPHYEGLQSAVRDSKFPIRLERHVTNMPELMAWADVGISGAGTTAWELAFMGVPSLLLIQADNQQATAEQLDALGVARDLGRGQDFARDILAKEFKSLLKVSAMRAEMARRGQELVDGNGVDRVLERLGANSVRFRPARDGDASLVWKWANDPVVREVSFSSKPIAWEEHVQWFKSKIEDTRCLLYIAVDSREQPLGQVRYELDRDEAVISIALDAAYRGRGYGATIIRLACWKLFEETPVSTVHAYVKDGNEASVRAFVKAQFKDVGATTISGQQARHLIARKEELS